jgi:hypothetical protein
MSREIPRKLLSDLFEQFEALPINPSGPLAQGSQTGEADEIENYVRGRRWPDLIYYFKKWDTSLTSTSFMTAVGLAATLPALLAAVLLWPEDLDTGVLIGRLLAPVAHKPTNVKDGFEFSRSGLSHRELADIDQSRAKIILTVLHNLSPAQRAAVRAVLTFLIEEDLQDAEFYASMAGPELQERIDRLWGLSIAD